MSRTVRVKYERSILRLLDNAEFREGEELEIIVVKRSFMGFREKAGRYRFKVDRDVVEELVEERR
ncbi:antitoxin family protein [Pyrodictium abyssi]|uniref:Antitoxin n=1 Tax=Pyrodictium abyssi TaxID=54256 RepID=A0ABM8IZB2_9CREN|nr:hypothetical protein PABY_24580 [Pyrodictium abyssi]